ncbi:MAG: SUMF1/EgtB/PvdO family nonheme iron enzyme [Polyangiaceae bacterium]|nr:SUMF1/EgtB/PvdO family nonheme iron enzyme [Polyangiaceae bacterium]
MSLPSVLKRSCLPLLGAGLLFACSSEDSGSSESGRTAAGGTGGTISVGGTAESGGTTETTGGIAESTGATSGGGVATGGGGTITGTGGGGVATGGVTGGTTETGGGGVATGGAATGGSTGGTVVMLDNPAPPETFTEDQVPGVSFDMVYVPGGTFTLGCEGSPCPDDTTPVPGVTVSSYHIAKNEVTAELWNAVMGGESSGFGGPRMNWYQAMEYACKLSQMTGRAYRMMTEAEFEYAAKNHLSSLEDIGSGEEWAYNSWNKTHSGGTDPVGPDSGAHMQKTRRDAQNTVDNITARLIRSIDGQGPQLRPVISAGVDFPPEYVPPCELTPPDIGEEPVNSYRDPRWVTGSDAHWVKGASGFGQFDDLRVWEDGTARLNNTDGQWFTSNNIVFVFVPSSGAIKKYPYIFLDPTQGSLISEGGFMNGYMGRIVKESADNYPKPTISGPKSGAELAMEAGDDFKMVDMENIPESAKEQDPRLIDGPGQCWFQDNTNAGGLHHYRKDVDPDEFRFTVNQGQMVMLANGEWFTVNNTFLRITHSTGYTTDYLYAVSPDGSYFYHDSYQGYERADFRMFQPKSNSESFPESCGSHCSSEIPKGEPAPFNANTENGHSTFVPAPCPADGCK